MKPKLYPLLCLLALFAALPPTWAQSAKTGSVSGRVFNPVTEEYVRNAQVRVVQTGEAAISETGGFYYLSGLPAGEVTLELRYIGYPVITTKATITSGATTTVDFELLAPATGGASQEEIVQLEKFVVSSEREGQAKAIMDQRASLNLTHVVSSDAFGSDPEGNIGEFLRNIPGVFLDTDQGEVTSVSFGGLSAEYVNVTVDGISLAAADANATSRASSFASISLSSMDSMEISRTISADVDASAPAGTINMRSKSAFDRRGTHIKAQATMSMSSAGTTLNKTFGPDDNGGVLKIRPGYIFEFSHAVKNRYGIIINVSESNIYSEADRVVLNINYTPNASDARPYVPTSISLMQSPRVNRRFATTIRGDWRVTPRLMVGLGLIYNYTRLWNLQRTATFNTGYTRGTPGSVLGSDPLFRFETTGTSSVGVNPVTVSKMAQGITITPRFEYRFSDLILDGLVSRSESLSWYESMERTGGVYTLNTPTAANVRYQVERSYKADATDFRITQISGPDISTGASFTKPSLFPEDDRDSTSIFLTGQLNATLMTRWLLPIQWKAGLKIRQEKRTYDRHYYMNRVTWTGDTTWANFKSPYEFDMGGHGVSIEPLGGGTLFMPNVQAIGDYYRAHPEEFTSFAPNSSQYRTDYYYSSVEYHRDFSERVDAGYLMATGMLFDKRLNLRAGLRYEKTSTDVLDPDPRSTAELADMGFSWTASSGIASTTEGIDYQFFSRPWKHRKNDYWNFFPSASIKYDLTANLALKLGMSTTIKRPTYTDLTGIVMVNDQSHNISMPNIYLKPENGRNYGVSLSYYFKGVGDLSVGVYQNDLRNRIGTVVQAGDEFAPGDIGGMGVLYPDYTFTTSHNRPGTTRVRSLEIGWTQNLGFIAPMLKRLVIRANYTRAYANYISTRVIPHSVNGGFSFTYGKFSVYSNCNWTDDYPISDTGISYRRHRTQIDVGGSYRFNHTYSLNFTARNLFDAKYVHMRQFPEFPGTGPLLYQSLQTGAIYSFSIKGEW